jgi:hypothetical protein
MKKERRNSVHTASILVRRKNRIISMKRMFVLNYPTKLQVPVYK